jgi:hypothetical protein
MRHSVPLLRRFAAKFVHDILPAALASVIGGFVFTHVQLLGRVSEPAAGRPASAEMIQLLRDEHGLMADFLKSEVAKEKAQLAAAAAATSPAADPADAAAVSTAPRQAIVAPAVLAMAAAKSAPLRSKTPVAAASLPPLVIAQAQPPEQDLKPGGRGNESLFAKTIGLKDHVVAVTHQVVSAIGGIPSWIGSIGDHIGGQDASPRPPADLVSAS